ncbi:MAG: metal ABC transporter substrate-binding protein [Lachnospiraceae bacterium]|nr:metal ABC transporter substrate-binding protein [Lachnospiraceae bacterium]
MYRYTLVFLYPKTDIHGGFTVKKTISLIIAAHLIMTCCLCACNPGNVQPSAEPDRLQIVTTVFPEYDWVRNILGDNPAKADVTMLLDTGVDLHSFQPTAEDILKISTCDLFIYVGGESDEWVADALQEATNKDMTVINLLDVLGDAVKEEEVVEGMQEEEHDHEHEEDHDESLGEHEEDHDEGLEEHEEDHDDHEEEHEHGEGEVEYDEHVWLSLKNAAVLVSSICDAIQKIDPDNAGSYKKNAEAYIEKLNALDAEYQAAVSAASTDTLLFGDRFPFRYLVDDYGLSYYAAFVGCSAETEASFETVTFLARKVDELSLPAVMTIEGTDHRIAETIVSNTQTNDQKILTLDSMQSVTAKDVENGTTYLSVMENNLSVLKDAL